MAAEKNYYLLICFDHFLALIPITIVNLNFIKRKSNFIDILPLEKTQYLGNVIFTSNYG